MSETVLIVGVKNLGKELAIHFGKLGARVVCAARTEADVRAVAADVDRAGGKGVPLVCDLTKPDTLEQLRDFTIDLCIASQAPGGRFGPKPFLEIDDAELTDNFSTTVVGTWNLLKAVAPGMVTRGKGTFLRIGTSSGVRTRDGFAVLGATHHAVRGLVQVAARELRPQGVHVAYLPIDGPIENDESKVWAKGQTETLIDAGEIARACEYLHRQQPRAWTHELVLRTARSEWTAPT